MSQGLQEGEIREGVAAGGHIRNGTVEHLVYIRPSWRRAYLPLRLWGDKANRTYLEDDPRLAQYKIVGSGQLGSVKQSESAVEKVPPREQ